MRIKLSLLSILLATSLFSQTRLEKPELYLGLTAGPTASMVMFTPTVRQSFLPGYNAGVMMRYIAEKNVGLQAELNFSQRGWKEAGGLFSRQLNYVELPFLTHIYIGDKTRFIINLGPKISYLLSENTLDNKTENSTAVQHVTAVQNPFDYGFCGGLGFQFAVHRNIFQLETRAYYALSDIYSNAKRDYFDRSNNADVSLNLAWLFQVK